MGALTENHRCPRGGRFSRIVDRLPTRAVGAVVGGITPVIQVGNPPVAAVLAAAALGGVLANAVRQAVGPHL
jgi:hypothetical protein